MEQNKEFSWNIGDLNIPLPIVQGGMGVGISLNGLAAAVASLGGIGTISAVGLNYICPDKKTTASQALVAEIKQARAVSPQGVLGVNIMFALTEFEDLAKTAMAEGIDIIFAGAGLPLDLPKLRTPDTKTKLVPIVSSAKAARLIAKWWFDKYQYLPDAFVVEGPLAGGHLGFKEADLAQPGYQLEALIAETLQVTEAIYNAHGKTIPLIAAGGIYDGKDMQKFLGLGATAVQLGTRFVATEECDASLAFKQAYLACQKEDVVIIKSPVGMPGRAIANGFLSKVALAEKTPTYCPFHCIKTCTMEAAPYCISAALIQAYKGNLDKGFAFVGANGYRIKQIVTVEQLMIELMSGLIS